MLVAYHDCTNEFCRLLMFMYSFLNGFVGANYRVGDTQNIIVNTSGTDALLIVTCDFSDFHSIVYVDISVSL